MNDLLKDTFSRVTRYLDGLDGRPVAPTPEAAAALNEFDFPLPAQGLPDREVLELLDRIGSSATVASAGGRYFGFVVGGSLPAALAANYLTVAWDQLSGLHIASPVAAKIETTAETWLVNLLELEEGTAAGFVTGATMANFTGLAVARSVLLHRAGWDVEEDGLFGAPELTVVVGEEYHASMRKALSLVGLGRSRVVTVPVDSQGCIRKEDFPEVDDRTIVCLQAGNVNTGSFDPLRPVSEIAREAGAWVHVDAAFGLWARAASDYKHLADGIELADSIATDAHKWLNVPYDSGIVFVKDRVALQRSMSSSAAYLIEGERRDSYKFGPEMSRRPRGVDVWAALLSLGREGLDKLISRNCQQARRFAGLLQDAGFEILNDVVLNQVLVSFGSPDQTREVIEAVQKEGTMWAGGTEWQGRTAMRISVSSWATTDADIDKSADAIIREARSYLASDPRVD